MEDPEYVPEGGHHRYAVADLITGYGVAQSLTHYYDLYHKRTVAGKKVIVQGWGNVASAAATYLAKEGALVVGIIDRAGGILAPHGLSLDDVKSLFIHKDGNKLSSPFMVPYEEVNKKIWDMEADIFIPGAASKLVTREQVDRMMKAGLEVISCGANVPFIDDDVFFGPTAKYVDEKISVIPDFIANCGMARVFAYLMQPEVAMTDHAIFTDASQTIRKALEEVVKINPAPNNISSNALYLALKKLGV